MTAADIKALEEKHPCNLDGCYTCAALGALTEAGEALKKYGDHLSWCHSHKRCDCGLSAMIATFPDAARPAS